MLHETCIRIFGHILGKLQLGPSTSTSSSCRLDQKQKSYSTKVFNVRIGM